MKKIKRRHDFIVKMNSSKAAALLPLMAWQIEAQFYRYLIFSFFELVNTD